MTETFFELIQVALGTRQCLSRTPSAKEWQMLYEMAKKQSLVGICFAGVQRLQSIETSGTIVPSLAPDHREEPLNLPEMDYLRWMGMAAKIQQRNEVVNRQCIELQAKLLAEGIASRILKGQGIASLYKCSGSNGSSLKNLRQSGDIDLWLDMPKEKVIDWAQAHGETEPAGYLHVGCHLFPDTEVELHYRPTYCNCLWHNARMQKFCEKHFTDYEERDRLVVPSWDFNVVYILSHIYRHLFGFGIGLRQLMDYYFVLKSKSLKVEESKSSLGQHVNVPTSQQEKFFNSLILDNLKSLGLEKFAGAVMYVMREVFLLEEQYLICPVDEKRGKVLLRDVMLMGNFGHHDEKQKEARKTMAGSLWWKVKRDVELVRFYPAETLSEPIWKIVRMINK